MPVQGGITGSSPVPYREEGAMPSKSPQKPSAKKAGKTLKEKREAKREKKEKRPPLG